MKFLSSQLAYVLGQREMRRNLRALLSYLALLAATIGAYSVLFHAIMLYEDQQHSWLTGIYWTLTVMSTLGFGDITFQSDLGRSFSILVLISGIVMLLIVLPFTFIRFFYAPWLEAQVRLRAPRRAAPGVRDHVIICHYDEIARGLIQRLGESGIGAQTGLNVIAVRHAGVSKTNPSAGTELPQDAELVMLGTAEQRRHFVQLFA